MLKECNDWRPPLPEGRHPCPFPTVAPEAAFSAFASGTESCVSSGSSLPSDRSSLPRVPQLAFRLNRFSSYGPFLKDSYGPALRLIDQAKSSMSVLAKCVPLFPTFLSLFFLFSTTISSCPGGAPTKLLQVFCASGSAFPPLLRSPPPRAPLCADPLLSASPKPFFQPDR